MGAEAEITPSAPHKIGLAAIHRPVEPHLARVCHAVRILPHNSVPFGPKQTLRLDTKGFGATARRLYDASHNAAANNGTWSSAQLPHKPDPHQARRTPATSPSLQPR